MSIKSTLSLFIFTLLFSSSFAQTDTVYFNADWSKSNDQIHDYYRVIKVSEDAVLINDFYKNGVKQMTGQIKNTKEALEKTKNGEATDDYAIGLFKYFNQDESVYLSIDHDPNLEEMLDSTKLANVEGDSLSYETTYYADGGINQEGLFTSMGQRHGKTTKRLKSGKLISEIEYNRGVQDGKEIYYYPNGQILTSTEYKWGVKHGDKLRYNSNGELKSSKHFENGDLQKPNKE